MSSPDEIAARLSATIENQTLKNDLALMTFNILVVQFDSDKIKYAYHPPVDPDTIKVVNFLQKIQFKGIRFNVYSSCTLSSISKYKDSMCVCNLFDNWYACEPLRLDGMDIHAFGVFLRSNLGVTEDPETLFEYLEKRASSNEDFAKALRHYVNLKAESMFDRPIGKCPICFSHWGLPYF